MKLVGGLPEDLSAAVFVVMHLAEESFSVLPKILDRSGPLKVVRAEDGERVEVGRVYVAPPAYHLLLEYGQVRVVRGPKENRHRPAVDPLFRSAAVAYGLRVVGAVLAARFEERARRAGEQVDLIRRVLSDGTPDSAGDIV